MPRKKSSAYAKPGSLAHPSLLPSERSISHRNKDHGAEVKSVNDRLQQLRLPPKGKRSKPFEAPPSQTIHPDLQNMLQIPYTPPPRPRPSLRFTAARQNSAGPPPPDSWLKTRSSERSKSESVMTNGRTAPELPGYDLPEPGTLLSSALKQVARDWDFHYEYDQYFLATIPVRFKELLLHFIALHKPYAIDRKSLQRLFLDEDELEGATGALGLSRLDLSTSLGRSLTLRDLKSFFKPRDRLFAAGTADTSTDVIHPSSLIPESWDSAALIQRPPLYLPPRLTTLTHLSLSCPSPKISWSYLLHHLLPSLPSQSLTHLSLAFWPFPTLCPNSLTATSLSPAGLIQAGGSNFYSSYDSDWTEPALILRRVARATLGLQWLDLTGNWPWIQALADKGFDWSGGGLWAGLETLVVGQGWVPKEFAPSLPCMAGCEHESDGAHHTHNRTDFIDNQNVEESDSSNTASTQRTSGPWQRLEALSSRYLSVPFRAAAYESMRSNPDGRALLEWVHTEHASLAFEQAIKKKLKQTVTAAPTVGMIDGEDDIWSLSVAGVLRTQANTEVGSASGRMEQANDDYEFKIAQRRKGVHFERGWSGDWVNDAIEEISKHEVDTRNVGVRTWMR